VHFGPKSADVPLEKRRFEIMSFGRANTSEGLQALAKHPNDGA
jgi:hypothetical protein